ncbi:selenocysteine-specific translation elongation factor [Blautia sp. Sow4_E7]|uniref:selenocysteine-specific translation elongation factor n=1 Tax=Blautia sp. Sow4_E7 TaxID=3438749 RepID=UPI003F934E21
MEKDGKKRYRIIGTAGHIDHGKTCLVKALTGTDTDRLAEEKKRGITIENGFAFLDLPDGTQAGIIDVPGHEKFIKNMLAGAGGIDIAMLVIAADEGVMPQTREHLEILSLLGIRAGIVVITKADLEWKAGLREKIQEFVRGTFLENADVVVTSAADGWGIEELREKLWNKIGVNGRETLSFVKRESGLVDEGKVVKYRLPIDRVFSLKGFGTIITGTLLDGILELDSDAMLYPRGEKAKIRSIQVHGEETSKAFPGQRVAVNLPGIGKDEISRGEILAAAGSMECTMMADVRLRLLKSAHRSIKSGTRVHLYHGAAELVCKVILFDQEILNPGEEAVVQLRMEQTTAMKAGDHFVIRFYSPVETIGGGVVLNPNAVKRRRKQRKLEYMGTGPQQFGAAQAQNEISDINIQKALQENQKDSFCPMGKKETTGSKAAGQTAKEIPVSTIFLRLQELYLKSGFTPPLTDEVKSAFSHEKDFSRIFFAMVRGGQLVRFDEKHYIHCEIREKALNMACLIYEEKGVIQTGEFRDRLGLSRKCAITLLEGFDKERITVMENGTRVLRKAK